MIQLISNINQKKEYGSIDEFLPFGFIPQYFMLNSLSAFNFHTVLNPVLVLAHQKKKKNLVHKKQLLIFRQNILKTLQLLTL